MPETKSAPASLDVLAIVMNEIAREIGVMDPLVDNKRYGFGAYLSTNLRTSLSENGF
jgi:hypothetical protein